MDCGFAVVTNWLNTNSSLVTAIATVVIAFASIVSARLFALQKKIERTSRMPILALVDEQTGDHRSMYVKNAGYGPALNIIRKVIEPGDLLRSKPQEHIIGALAPKDRAYAFIATLPPNSSTSPLDDPKFHAVIECDDILDGHYEFTYRNRTLSMPLRVTKRKMPPVQADRL
jgi:hypothetical protein